MSNPVDLLKSYSQDHIDLYQDQVRLWVSSFYYVNSDKKYCSNLKLLLETYNAFPWYKRWWQRFTLPINKLETFYYAQQFSTINVFSYTENLVLLNQGYNQLSWFSPLLTFIIRARIHCQKMIKNVDDRSFLTASSSDLSTDIFVQPQIPRINISVSMNFFAPDLILYLPHNALDACEKLGIDRNQNITWKMIRQAYIKSTFIYHPDKNIGNTEKATKQFIECLNSYELIKKIVENFNEFDNDSLMDNSEYEKERKKRMFVYEQTKNELRRYQQNISSQLQRMNLEMTKFQSEQAEQIIIHTQNQQKLNQNIDESQQRLDKKISDLNMRLNFLTRLVELKTNTKEADSVYSCTSLYLTNK